METRGGQGHLPVFGVGPAYVVALFTTTALPYRSQSCQTHWQLFSARYLPVFSLTWSSGRLIARYNALVTHC